MSNIFSNRLKLVRHSTKIWTPSTAPSLSSGRPCLSCLQCEIQLHLTEISPFSISSLELAHLHVKYDYYNWFYIKESLYERFTLKFLVIDSWSNVGLCYQGAMDSVFMCCFCSTGAISLFRLFLNNLLSGFAVNHSAVTLSIN